MNPTEGIRILLERREVDEDGRAAGYQASIFTPTHRFDYQALLDAAGEATLTPEGEGAGGDLEKRLLAIARSTARAAARRREEELSPWPQRVLRWRRA